MAEEVGIQTVALDSLVESPFWCRQFEEDQDFLELVESVKRIGVIEPPMVRPVNGKLEIVHGHRRVLAARKAELKTILADVRKVSDEDAMDIQLAENIHRKDLTGMEKARSLRMRIEKTNCTQSDLAKRIGKSEAWVSLHLQMLELEPKFTSVKNVTEGQARELLRVPEEKREEIIEKAEETGTLPSAKEIRLSSKPSPTNHETFIHANGLVDCEIGMHPVAKERTVQIEGHTVCLAHREEGKRRFTELEKVEAPQKLYKETAAFRVAQMHPHDSKMQEQTVEKLVEKGVRGISQNRNFCLVSVEPDLLIGNVAVFLDGAEAHKNRTDKDEQLRELLEKRHGVKVVSITYSSCSEKETARVANEILSKLPTEE